MEPTPKNPLESRTIRWAILGIISLLAGLFGADTDRDGLAALLDIISANWESIAGVFTLVMTIIYRIKATRPIQLPKGGAAPLVGAALFACQPVYAGPEKSIVVEDSPATEPRYGFYVDGFTAGLFPTDANNPEPLDIEGSLSGGGGAMLGYRFNDVVAVAVGGQLIRSGSVWVEDYHVDLLAYLPEGNGSALADFISVPDLGRAEVYLLLGVGAHRFDGAWDSIVRAGAGAQMPITPEATRVFYFIEATYNVTGLGTADPLLDPFVAGRTGIRILF